MTNKLKRVEWSVFLLALVLRLTAVFIFGETSDPQLWEYGPIARNIVAGLGYSTSVITATDIQNIDQRENITLPSAYMPPGYSLFLAVFLATLGEKSFSFLIVLIVHCFVGALAAVVLYRVSLTLFHEEVAKLAGLLCALYPPFVYATLDFGPTTLYLAALGTMWLLGLSIINHPSVSRSILAGLTAGSLSLFRADGTIVSIALSAWLFLKGHSKYAAIFLIAMFVGISPWLGRNYIVFNEFVPMTTSFGLNFWRGHNMMAPGTGRDESGAGIWGSPEIDQKISHLRITPRYEIERDSLFFQEALHFITTNPQKELFLAFKKIFFLWILDLTHPKAQSLFYILPWAVILSLFFIGLYETVMIRYDVSFLLLYYAAMMFIAVTFFVLPRYQIILTYGVIPLSAFGAQQLFLKLRTMMRSTKRTNHRDS